MEKIILELMETAENMQLGELKDELELAVKSSDPFSYVTIEVIKNEINKRQGKRHIPLIKAQEIFGKAAQ